MSTHAIWYSPLTRSPFTTVFIFFCVLSSLISSLPSLLSPFSHHHHGPDRACLSSSAASLNFLCRCVWQLRIISRLLSTTSCLLSATPLPISLHRRHLPFFFRLAFLPGSRSLFIMSLSSFSSSLSYIIQASASHSEIKARACVPSKLQTRWLLEGQTGLCPRGL